MSFRTLLDDIYDPVATQLHISMTFTNTILINNFIGTFHYKHKTNDNILLTTNISVNKCYEAPTLRRIFFWGRLEPESRLTVIG